MPSLNFIKYHGLGNDFLIVDALDHAELRALPWATLAPRWCDRHTGVGADGLLILEPADGTGFQPLPMPTHAGLSDLRMRIFNADGSEAQMCGNGIRCIAKYMLEHRGWPRETLNILTGRGVLPITYELGPGRRMRAATVDMGEPILDPAQIPVRLPVPRIADFRTTTDARTMTVNTPLLDYPIELPTRLDAEAEEALRRSLGSLSSQATPSSARATAARAPLTLPITCVSMGNPHAVVFCSDIASIPLNHIGPALEHHPFFPQRANIQFLQIQSPARALLRTWERGAGPTRACGTGACAALVAAVLTRRLARAATLELPGGELVIRWDESTNHVFMTGPAEEIYRGSLQIP